MKRKENSGDEKRMESKRKSVEEAAPAAGQKPAAYITIPGGGRDLKNFLQ